MKSNVNRFIKRLGLFAVPFAVYIAVIIIVDPYEYIAISSIIPESDKKEISFKLNYAMWKLMQYRNNPTPNILLGDSRMMGMEPEDIVDRTGLEYVNLAYGGGSLKEAFATFWFATERTRLENVCIGVNFSIYNATQDKNRVREVQSALDNPLLYFINLNVLTATGKLLAKTLFGHDANIGEPPMNQEEFWEYQLEETTRRFSGNYRYPAEYYAELKRISQYCHENGIDMRVVVLPNHTDLRQALTRLGRVNDYIRFKSDLRTISTVYDFDFSNPLTDNRKNYSDPYHMLRPVRAQIIDGIWGEDQRFVRITSPQVEHGSR